MHSVWSGQGKKGQGKWGRVSVPDSSAPYRADFEAENEDIGLEKPIFGRLSPFNQQLIATPKVKHRTRALRWIEKSYRFP